MNLNGTVAVDAGAGKARSHLNLVTSTLPSDKPLITNFDHGANAGVKVGFTPEKSSAATGGVTLGGSGGGNYKFSEQTETQTVLLLLLAKMA